MKLLLDTHAYLWMTLDEPGLTPPTRQAIRDLQNELFVSAASYWEISIKISLGDYQLQGDFVDFWETTLRQNQIQILPIELRHARRIIDLPHHHRDPFDRMIVAQALEDDLTLVSSDASLDAYGATRIV